MTYVVYSVIINTEHTFYIGEYKNEKRTKPRGRVGMHSSALFYIRAAPQSFSLKEALIKSGMQIAQTDFSVDCMKMTQEYLMYFKEFSCNQAENMQARCVPRFIQRFLKFPTAAAPVFMPFRQIRGAHFHKFYKKA